MRSPEAAAACILPTGILPTGSRRRARTLSADRTAQPLPAAGAAHGGGDPRIADRLTRIAERIESIAGAFDAQAPAGAANPTGAPAPGDDAPAAGRG